MPYKIGGGRKPQSYDPDTGRYGGASYYIGETKQNESVSVTTYVEGKTSSDMPNYHSSVTPDEKFLNYSLDENSERGKDKAIVYQAALGYNKSNYQSLKSQIHNSIVNGNANMTKIEDTFYGKKYTFEIQIKGENGKSATIVAAYIIKKGQAFPRMVTNYVK